MHVRTRPQRFSATNGVACWRCCPRPLAAFGECTCECHRRVPCPRCNGRGDLFHPVKGIATSRCPRCHGDCEIVSDP